VSLAKVFIWALLMRSPNQISRPFPSIAAPPPLASEDILRHSRIREHSGIFSNRRFRYSPPSLFEGRTAHGLCFGHSQAQFGPALVPFHGAWSHDPVNSLLFA